MAVDEPSNIVQHPRPSDRFRTRVEARLVGQPFLRGKLIDDLNRRGFNWDTSTLTKALAGVRGISLDEAVAIADHLGMSIDDHNTATPTAVLEGDAKVAWEALLAEAEALPHLLISIRGQVARFVRAQALLKAQGVEPYLPENLAAWLRVVAAYDPDRADSILRARDQIPTTTTMSQRESLKDQDRAALETLLEEHRRPRNWN